MIIRQTQEVANYFDIKQVLSYSGSKKTSKVIFFKSPEKKYSFCCKVENLIMCHLKMFLCEREQISNI